MDPNAMQCLKNWSKRVRRIQLAHVRASEQYDRLNYLFGVPVVVLSTFIGTSIASTTGSDHEPVLALKILLGALSTMAAVLASLQTFLRYAERAEKHRASAVRFGALRREIEQILAVPPKSLDESRSLFCEFRVKWDKLSEESLTIPRRLWQEATADIANKQEDRSEGLQLPTCIDQSTKVLASPDADRR